MMNFLRRNKSNSNANASSNQAPSVPVVQQQQQQMPEQQQQQGEWGGYGGGYGSGSDEEHPPPSAPVAPAEVSDAVKARIADLFTDVYTAHPTASSQEVPPALSADGMVEVRGINSRDFVLKGRTTQSHASIDLQTLLLGDKVKRSPFELTVCLDVSGSMSGRPIETAKETIVEMLDQMSGGDLINLVVYSNSAEVKFKDVGPDRKDWAKEEVAKVRAGGGTNIEMGLKNAIDLFEKSEAPENSQRAIFLLSDGHPNGGVTSASGLAEVAATACKKRARLSSIGIGSDYNEDVLRAICDAGEGDYLHVRSTENITECITAAFQGLTTSVGSDAILFVEATEHGRATKAENYTSAQLRDGLPMGVLRQDNLRQVVLHLESNAKGAVGEVVELCRYRFQYKSGVTEQVETVSGAVQAIVTEDDKDLLTLQMDVVVAYRLIELGNASEVIKDYVDSDKRTEARAVQDKCIEMLEAILPHDRSRRKKVAEMLRSMRETRVQMEKPRWDRQYISKKSAYVQRCNQQQEEWMYSLA